MNQDKSIRIAIVGVGNCASSLYQGLHYYGKTGSTLKRQDTSGLMRDDIGGYRPEHIQVVAAYDIDARKVGKPFAKAIQQPPNCTAFYVIPEDLEQGPIVQMGVVLDGVAPHMETYPEQDRFLVATEIHQPSKQEIIAHLKSQKVDLLINYLPVGSQAATEFYVECCLEARIHLCNCIPVFIASNTKWEARFRDRGLVLIGDDMKSQFGASILSQMLEELATARGHHVRCHIQRNVGGNTDFLNMVDKSRLASKRISKENVLRGVRAEQGERGERAERAERGERGERGERSHYVYAGPSEYIPYYGDNKIANIHLEMDGFMGAPVVLDAQLSVIDSPNSAGVVIDAIRYLKVAAELGICGALRGPSAFTQKTPPEFISFREAQIECEALANRKRTERTNV